MAWISFHHPCLPQWLSKPGTTHVSSSYPISLIVSPKAIYSHTCICGGFAAPRIRNVEHGGLVTISGRSPRLLLCTLIWCYCVSAAVDLPLCICRCGSAAVDLPLCIYHCIYCVVYPPLYLLLYINHCVCCVVYPLLYLPLYIHRCIFTSVSAVLLRVIEYKERLNYLSYKSDCLPNYLIVESMPLYA
jgi:hypothetical protein